MNRKALGRGLGALLGSDQIVSTGQETLELELDLIDPGSEQPRMRFDEEALERLAVSIREHGVVQPILVRRKGGRYELIAGERRWRAAQRAGLGTIPVIVKEVADSDLLEIALTENVQREDLNPIEEAQAYQKLIERVGLTQEALASRFGRDRSYITNYLRLLRLPDDLQRLVEDGRLSTGHARTVLGLPHIDQQRRVARHVLEKGLSVRATEALVKKHLDETPGSTRRSTTHTADPNIRAAENKLRRAFGTQVRILQGSLNGPGRIEIAFFNDMDLDRIYSILTRHQHDV
ncbi:MAG TPA: ParB/RepB/Spo0J family partition protein [Pyrinomonadaceae bacterium]|jgi:ParB family chromosome partitioning protein